MTLNKFAVAGMNAYFRRRQRKDQPALPGIDRLEVRARREKKRDPLPDRDCREEDERR